MGEHLAWGKQALGLVEHSAEQDIGRDEALHENACPPFANEAHGKGSRCCGLGSFGLNEFY